MKVVIVISPLLWHISKWSFSNKKKCTLLSKEMGQAKNGTIFSGLSIIQTILITNLWSGNYRI